MRRKKDVFTLISILFFVVLFSSCKYYKHVDGFETSEETKNRQETERFTEKESTIDNSGENNTSSETKEKETEEYPVFYTEAETHESEEESGTETDPWVISESETGSENGFSVISDVFPRIDIVTLSGKDIKGSSTDKPEYECEISVSECKESLILNNLKASVRVRGNSTAGTSKKPYTVTFDEKCSLLGLNEGHEFKKWVLLADYYDLSMLRNYTALKLGRVMKDENWFVADCTHVRLYLNGSFKGIYLLTEHTDINKNRVNIEKTDATNSVKTGYLLIGQGGLDTEEDYFDVCLAHKAIDSFGTSNHIGIRLVLSGNTDYNDTQRAFIKNYLFGVFSVLTYAIEENTYYMLDEDGNLIYDSELNENSGMSESEKQKEAIDRVIDLDTFARMYVLEEIVKSFDSTVLNMCIDLSENGEKKLKLTSPWDYDMAFSNVNRKELTKTEGFYAGNWLKTDGYRQFFGFVLLAKTDWFMQMSSDIYREYREEFYEVLNESLQEAEIYSKEFISDYNVNGKPSKRDMMDFVNANRFKTDSYGFFASEVTDWLKNRLNWLDTVWGE